MGVSGRYNFDNGSSISANLNFDSPSITYRNKNFSVSAGYINTGYSQEERYSRDASKLLNQVGGHTQAFKSPASNQDGWGAKLSYRF